MAQRIALYSGVCATCIEDASTDIAGAQYALNSFTECDREAGDTKALSEALDHAAAAIASAQSALADYYREDSNPHVDEDTHHDTATAVENGHPVL